MSTIREPRLGIDIGRVIINGAAHPGGGDTAFFGGDEATMLATPEMDGCGPAVARLTELFGGRVWLVSKCGPRVQARTLRWLQAHDFYGRTGVPRDHARFCRRADKRAHCEELRLTHFVDDHPEVHAAIRGAVEHQYLFGPQRVPRPCPGHSRRHLGGCPAADRGLACRHRVTAGGVAAFGLKQDQAAWQGPPRQRGVRTQNSLPSGSARTVHGTSPWPTSMSAAPRARSRATSAAWSSPG